MPRTDALPQPRPRVPDRTETANLHVAVPCWRRVRYVLSGLRRGCCGWSHCLAWRGYSRSC